MSIPGNEVLPNCAILCQRLSPDERRRCPGVLSMIVGPPVAASETVPTLVEVCRNPAKKGGVPVFSESWDDGADTLTLFEDDMPGLKRLALIIESARNF